MFVKHAWKRRWNETNLWKSSDQTQNSSTKQLRKQRRMPGDKYGKKHRNIHTEISKQSNWGHLSFAEIIGWKMIYPLFWTRQNQMTGLTDFFLSPWPAYWHWADSISHREMTLQMLLLVLLTIMAVTWIFRTPYKVSSHEWSHLVETDLNLCFSAIHCYTALRGKMGKANVNNPWGFFRALGEKNL